MPGAQLRLPPPLRLHSPSFQTRFFTPLSEPMSALKMAAPEQTSLSFQNHKSKDAKRTPILSLFNFVWAERPNIQKCIWAQSKKIVNSSTSFRHDVLTHFIPHLVCAWRVSIYKMGTLCATQAAPTNRGFHFTRILEGFGVLEAQTTRTPRRENTSDNAGDSEKGA